MGNRFKKLGYMCAIFLVAFIVFIIYMSVSVFLFHNSASSSYLPALSFIVGMLVARMADMYCELDELT